MNPHLLHSISQLVSQGYCERKITLFFCCFFFLLAEENGTSIKVLTVHLGLGQKILLMGGTEDNPLQKLLASGSKTVCLTDQDAF